MELLALRVVSLLDVGILLLPSGPFQRRLEHHRPVCGDHSGSPHADEPGESPQNANDDEGYQAGRHEK
jgi:hypothetical protein